MPDCLTKHTMTITMEKDRINKGRGRMKTRYYVVDGAVFSSRKKATEHIKEKYNSVVDCVFDKTIYVCYLDEPEPVAIYEVDTYTMCPEFIDGDPYAEILDNEED